MEYPQITWDGEDERNHENSLHPLERSLNFFFSLPDQDQPY